MSDQSDALNKQARDRGILPPEEPPAPENGGGAIADLLNGDLPKVQLPGEGWLLSQFAREIGRIVSKQFMYRRESAPVMVNPRRRRLDLVDADAFRSLVEQKLCCIKLARHKESTFTIVQTMPVDAARGTLRAPEFLEALPEVDRVNTVRLPAMRASGKIELLPEGYDTESRTYTFSSPGVDYDETMTLDAAVGVLTSLTSEFPFGDWLDAEGKPSEEHQVKSRSQAVVVAGMLTMFAAGVLPARAARPCFIYTSNSPRTGKTLLAQLATVTARGSGARESWPAREEEMKKLIESAVQDSAQFLLFDNLRGHVHSQALETLITADEVSGRVLGSKARFTAPNEMTIFLTGNQATVNEDIFGRSLFVELFLAEANVQQRSLSREIDVDWLLDPKNRSLVLSALWAIVRSWDADGRKPNETRKAGFHAWTRTIGGMVLHAGLGDCLEEAKLDTGGNTEMQDMSELVQVLSKIERPGNEDFEFTTIVNAAVAAGLFDWILTSGADDLSPKEKSTFGKLLKKYACGRLFAYEDGTRLKFGHRGKHRGRRYMLARA